MVVLLKHEWYAPCAFRPSCACMDMFGLGDLSCIFMYGFADVCLESTLHSPQDRAGLAT